MKPKVDNDACIGCGTCESLCPDVFKVTDEGKVDVLDTDYEASKECIDQSIEACPVQVISI